MSNGSEIGAWKIREMKQQDLDGVYAVSCEAFTEPWQRADLDKELENPDAHYFVAVSDDVEEEVLGYVGYWQVLDEGHIMNVAVLKKARGNHLGTALVAAMLQSGAPRGIFYWTLEVRVSNIPAITLYENAGFVSAGKRPGYYSNPKEDAFIYWLKPEDK